MFRSSDECENVRCMRKGEKEGEKGKDTGTHKDTGGSLLT